MKKTALALTLLLCAARARGQEGFGENKIVYDQFDWRTYRSTHFTVYFYEKERSSLQKVASYAESAYDDISRQLNFQIPKPINLAVLRNALTQIANDTKRQKLATPAGW